MVYNLVNSSVPLPCEFVINRLNSGIKIPVTFARIIFVLQMLKTRTQSFTATDGPSLSKSMVYLEIC